MFAGKGHPVFDHLAMYSHYVFLPSFCTEEEFNTRNNMTRSDAEALFDRYLEQYYPKADKAELADIKETIKGVHAAQISLASVRIPGVFNEEILREVKERAVSFSRRKQLADMESGICEWSRLE